LEKRYKISRNSARHFILLLASIIILMYVCYMAGYFLAKKSAPSHKDENAQYSNEVNYENQNKPFPNLPVNISGTYEEPQDFTPDNNDYLVICEGNLVNLYVINEDGDKIFDSVLEIDISSLTSDDKNLLNSGIMLSDKEDLLSLIEDYTS